MNQTLFYYLNSFAGKTFWLDGIIIFFGKYLAYILAAIFLIIVIKNKNWKMFWLGAVSVFISRIVFTETIRYFYYVPRPFINNTVHQLIFHETSGSFPSGHAAFFFALATTFFFFHKKWGLVFFSAAFLMGLGRIIAGVHWPVDILGGAIIGIFSSLLICKILQNRLYLS